MRAPTPLRREDAARLETALARLDAAFAGRRSLARLGVCETCCLPPAVAQRLRTTPRDALGIDDLAEYLYAPGGPETGESFAYLLPRLLRALATDPQGGALHFIAAQLTLDRLPHARALPDWSAAEERATAETLIAIARQLVADPLSRAYSFGPFLTMAARGGYAVRPLLAPLAAARAAQRARVVALWLSDAGPLEWDVRAERLVLDRIWWPAGISDAPAIAFLSDPARRREIESAFFSESDAAWRERFSTAEAALPAV